MAREPVSHIIGRKAFWTLDLIVNPSVLTPRPETEFLVDFALTMLPKTEPARLLDLGVGSGAILLSVLAEQVVDLEDRLDVGQEIVRLPVRLRFGRDARHLACHVGEARKLTQLTRPGLACSIANRWLADVIENELHIRAALRHLEITRAGAFAKLVPAAIAYTGRKLADTSSPVSPSPPP